MTTDADMEGISLSVIMPSWLSVGSGLHFIVLAAAILMVYLSLILRFQGKSGDTGTVLNKDKNESNILNTAEEGTVLPKQQTDQGAKKTAKDNALAKKGESNFNFQNLVERSRTMLSNNWRCACQGGFLPPAMFGGAEAVFWAGTGECYHKQI